MSDSAAIRQAPPTVTIQGCVSAELTLAEVEAEGVLTITPHRGTQLVAGWYNGIAEWAGWDSRLEGLDKSSVWVSRHRRTKNEEAIADDEQDAMAVHCACANRIRSIHRIDGNPTFRRESHGQLQYRADFCDHA
jgi:hypothetical protein